MSAGANRAAAAGRSLPDESNTQLPDEFLPDESALPDEPLLPDDTRPSRAPARAHRRPPRERTLADRLAKPAVFALALVPAAWMLGSALLYPEELGANPIKEVEHRTGDWALRFVVLSLALTPLRRLLGWTWTTKYRRMVGLFAFFYATVHLLVFAALDLELQLGEVVGEIVKRPYITVGFLSWLMLVPLALTSTKGWIRRLGGARWSRLHRLVYLVGVGGVVHYYWSVKKDVTLPLVYAAIVALLLGYRLWLRRGDGSGVGRGGGQRVAPRVGRSAVGDREPGGIVAPARGAGRAGPTAV